MPEANQVHIDAALTNVSVAFTNNDFIADLVAPPVAVRKQSDRYYVYDADRDWLRAEPDLRAPGTEANEIGFLLSSDSYYCEDHALESAIADEERENADPAIQPDIDRTEFLTEKIALNREMALQKLLRDSGEIPQDVLDAGERWNSPDNDPLTGIRAAANTVFANCQRRANVVIMPMAVFETVRNHASVVDRIKHTVAGTADEQLLAGLLGIDRVLVPRSVKNTAPKGRTPVIEPVWGNDIYVLHVAPKPSPT